MISSTDGTREYVNEWLGVDSVQLNRWVQFDGTKIFWKTHLENHKFQKLANISARTSWLRELLCDVAPVITGVQKWWYRQFWRNNCKLVYMSIHNSSFLKSGNVWLPFGMEDMIRVLAYNFIIVWFQNLYKQWRSFRHDLREAPRPIRLVQQLDQLRQIAHGQNFK